MTVFFTLALPVSLRQFSYEGCSARDFLGRELFGEHPQLHHVALEVGLSLHYDRRFSSLEVETDYAVVELEVLGIGFLEGRVALAAHLDELFPVETGFQLVVCREVFEVLLFFRLLSVHFSSPFVGDRIGSLNGV